MACAVQLIRAPGLSDVAEYAHAATAPPEARPIFLAGACSTRVLVGTVLGYDDQLVEIEAVKAVIRSSTDRLAPHRSSRAAMNV